jgi:hypothetical protein
MNIGEILRKIADAVDAEDGITTQAADPRLQNPAELVDVVVIDTPDSTVNDQSVVPSDEDATALAIVDRIKQLSGIPL